MSLWLQGKEVSVTENTDYQTGTSHSGVLITSGEEPGTDEVQLPCQNIVLNNETMQQELPKTTLCVKGTEFMKPRDPKRKKRNCIQTISVRGAPNIEMAATSASGTKSPTTDSREVHDAVEVITACY